MKKILITGKNSYVGNSFAEWAEQHPDQYEIDKISLRNDAWKEVDFSKYDVVLHVAGIAHVSTDPNMEELYYKINRDLTVEVAKKAKKQGVAQFIFMSSIIIYGEATSYKKVINRDTVPNPANFYGKSKLEAEKSIQPLEDENFRIAIIRPPMIYGKDSKGNYPKLAKIARKLPIFPDFPNERSMLHIDNLSEFIRLMIDNKESGVFFPQNKEYVKTSEMVRLIGEAHGKKVRMVKIFNPIIKLFMSRVTIFNKVFGNLVYDSNLSKYKENYVVRNLKSSISATELERGKQ